jgi:hypothetical protein
MIYCDFAVLCITFKLKNISNKKVFSCIWIASSVAMTEYIFCFAYFHVRNNGKCVLFHVSQVYGGCAIARSASSLFSIVPAQAGIHTINKTTIPSLRTERSNPDTRSIQNIRLLQLKKHEIN